MFIRRSTSFINGIFDFLKLQIKFVDVEQTEKKILREKAGRKICFGMTFQGLVSLGQMTASHSLDFGIWREQFLICK